MGSKPNSSAPSPASRLNIKQLSAEQTRAVTRRLMAYAARQPARWLIAITTLVLATFLTQAAARFIPCLPNELDPSAARADLPTILRTCLLTAQPAEDAPTPDLPQTWQLLFLMLALILVGTLISRQARYRLPKLGQDLLVDVRTDYYASIMRQSGDFFRRYEMGTLTSVGMNDTEIISGFFYTHIPYFVQSGAQFALALLFMLTLDWRLTLGSVLLVALIYGLTQYIFTPPIQRLAANYQRTFARVNSTLAEDLAAVRDIQVFTQEARVTREFRQELGHLAKGMTATARWQSWSLALFQLLEAIGPVLIFGVGAVLILQGSPIAKLLGSFAFYFSQLVSPVYGLSRSMVTIQSTLVAAHRVFTIMDEEPAIQDRPNAIDPGPLRGHIRFEDVTFSYTPEDPAAWRVKNLNLEIRPGEKVAIVGGSGTGKSTLFGLIARLLEVSDGRVTIDGYDVRDLALTSLRGNLGLVAQNVILFRGTLADNIRFPRPEATLDEVKAAAQIGYVTEFVDNLDNDFNTVLGEMGQGLSGGQKQRVSIARAALENSPILLLDEATSALDTQSELHVTRALDQLMRGRTAVVIAHRLSTIRNADKIVVMGTDEQGHGVIRAIGTHDELMEGSPEYVALYGRQRRRGILMPIGPLYDTTAALPTVIGLAEAYKAPVYLLDFGPVKMNDETDSRRFGISVVLSSQDPRVVNARHIKRVTEVQRRLKAEGVAVNVIHPRPEDQNRDWVEVTLDVIAETEATHLVAVDNVLVPLEKLRESIRLIERKGGVEYILVNPIAGVE
jgi:ABC-type multidrug transport system fused ATPase/permease subunit